MGYFKFITSTTSKRKNTCLDFFLQKQSIILIYLHLSEIYVSNKLDEAKTANINQLLKKLLRHLDKRNTIEYTWHESNTNNT